MSTERITIEVSQRGAKVVSREIGEIGKSSKTSHGEIGKLKKLLGTLAVGAAITTFVRNSVNEFRTFNLALGEVNTLVGQAPEEMLKLETGAKNLAKEFGIFPAEQVKAQYQIISAGAADAAEANETLRVANELALGGVTNLAVAATGLTNVLNVWGEEAGGAQAVSDSLFTAVKMGVTTVDQLASSIGNVSSIAATMGLTVDETTSSIAALTKTGLSTNVAVTGLRGVLATLAKPTKEAAEAANALGIEFSPESIKKYGSFTNFLDVLKEKTGGSTEELVKLFPNIEALAPILNLVGKGGEYLNETLEEQKNKLGATSEAAKIMSMTLDNQLNQVMAKVNTGLIESGGTLSNLITPALILVNENFETVANTLGTIAITVIPVLITAFATLGKSFMAALGPAGWIALSIGAIAGLIIKAKSFHDEMQEVKDNIKSVSDIGTETTAFDQLNKNLSGIQKRMEEVKKVSGETSPEFKALKSTADDLKKGIKNLATGVVETNKTMTDGKKATDEARTAIEKHNKFGIKPTKEGLTKLQTELKKTNTDFRSLKDTLDPIGAIQRKFTDDLEKLRKGFELNNTPIEEQDRLLQALGNTYKDSIENADEFIQKQREQEEAFNDLLDVIYPLQKEFDDHADKINLVHKQYNNGNITLEEHTKILYDLEAANMDLGDTTVQTAQVMYDVWKQTGEALNNILNDLVTGGITSFDDLWEAGKTGIAGMLVDWQKQILNENFDLSKIFSSGKIDMGAIGSALLPMVATTAYQTAVNYVDKKYGNEASTGFQLGGVPGAILGKLIAGLGADYEFRNAGYELQYDNNEFTGSRRNDYVKDRFGSDNAHKSEFQGLESEMNNFISDSFTTVRDITTNLGISFGKTAEEISQGLSLVVTDVQINDLVNKSEEEISAEIQNWIDETTLKMIDSILPDMGVLISSSDGNISDWLAPLSGIGEYLNNEFAPTLQENLSESLITNRLSLDTQLEFYDGSLTATQDMANTIQQRTVLEQQMLDYIFGLRESLANSSDALRDMIYKDTHTTEEYYNKLVKDLDQLAINLSNAVTPEEIQDLRQTIDQKTSEAWNILTEEQKIAIENGTSQLVTGIDGTYSEFISGVQQVTENKLSQFETDLRNERIELGIAIEGAMTNAANRLIDAANALIGAANTPQQVNVAVTQESSSSAWGYQAGYIPSGIESEDSQYRLTAG